MAHEKYWESCKKYLVGDKRLNLQYFANNSDKGILTKQKRFITLIHVSGACSLDAGITYVTLVTSYCGELALLSFDGSWIVCY